MSSVNNPLSPLPIYPGTTPRFHAMVKPTGAICNLDCAYCYYLHKEELLGSNSKFRISDEILETHIRQYIEGQHGDEVVFSWQGGEPTLLGVEFFEKVVALEKKYQRPGLHIENDLQTNGTLLNDEWCEFLRKNKLPGRAEHRWPAGAARPYRVNKGGKPTFDKVFAAGCRCAAAWHSVQHADGRQSRQCEKAAGRLSFPEPRGSSAADAVHSLRRAQGLSQRRAAEVGPGYAAAAGLSRRSSRQSRLRGHGLVGRSRRLGLLPLQDLGRLVSPRLRQGARQPVRDRRCAMDGPRLAALRLSASSAAKAWRWNTTAAPYSCDHYVYPEYKLGNIAETHESRMVFSEEQKKFGFAKRDDSAATVPRVQILVRLLRASVPRTG